MFASEQCRWKWKRQRPRKGGFVLLIVLIFIFVITLLAVTSSENVILENKMQINYQKKSEVEVRAEQGLEQMVLATQGQSITLPTDEITLNTSHKIISIDTCGNQTIAFESTAQNTFAKVVLNSLDIFAKVPHEKGCAVIPTHQIIGWKME